MCSTTPTWRRHLTQNTFVDGDTMFLAIQERLLKGQAHKGKWQAAYYLATPSDLAILGARK